MEERKKDGRKDHKVELENRRYKEETKTKK